MPNRLAQETSPYLQQHAGNPVDWYPWGEEAFARARAEDKPILLSIGYAACHWCHVMAHESFEDEATAALMNRYFINVKVDREERPDVDQIYMNAVIAMTRHGGWPMTVALTPDGRPFYGGTYYPSAPRYGMPSFQQVLLSLADAWEKDRDKILESAAGITEHLSRTLSFQQEGQSLTRASLQRAAALLGSQFDEKFGGFGEAPKFPQPMNLEFLLRQSHFSGDESLLNIVDKTLDQMARGGIYDQIGGGFARYSTDSRWLVPHFEKMLYDNAQLARIYLHAWQATGRPFYRQIAEETLDYVLREMTHEAGGFFSSQDADSEGVEGKFYVWTLEEARELLGDELFPVSVVFDITAHGNWEGKNILHMPRPLDEAAAVLKMSPEALAEILTRAKSILYEARSRRIWPGLDDKVLTAWNGLMMAAFAEAGRALKRPDYTAAAIRCAEFLWKTMRTAEGRLLRTWKDGHAARLNGYLEDYAFLADGLLALYQSTFEARWFSWAVELADKIITHFHDADRGSFFDTSDDHETLIYRPQDTQDNALPSGSSAACLALLQLSLLTGESRYAALVEPAVEGMYGALMQVPGGFGHWLTAAALMVHDRYEVAIAGNPGDPETTALVDVVFDRFRPHHLVAAGPPDSPVPLLHHRTQIDGRPTAYLCQNFACQMPTADTAELAAQLAGS